MAELMKDADKMLRASLKFAKKKQKKTNIY